MVYTLKALGTVDYECDYCSQNDSIPPSAFHLIFSEQFYPLNQNLSTENHYEASQLCLACG